MITFFMIFQGIAGLLLLYYGAEFLVKGGVEVAQRFHISQLVIGLTLISTATSAPELVVSCNAALQNSGDIAVGNVMGSNICNIALILGLCAIITPLRVNIQLFKWDVPVMIGCTMLFSGIYWFCQGINRWWGMILFICFILYTLWGIHKCRNSSNVQNLEISNSPLPTIPLWLAITLILGGIGMLVSGAKLLVSTAIWIAELLKISQAVIALTVVAIGTSLPELATSVVAAIKGERDIAIGNVVGSSIFNILAILGLSSLLHPLNAPGIKTGDFIVMITATILLYPFMKSGYTISRKEGISLLTIYIGYTIWLIVS